METTKSIWMNGKLVPWDEAKIHVLTHTLHYGSGVFEGLRVYKTDKGPAIFRLKEHTQRLLYSASVFKMNVPYSLEELMQAHIDVVKDAGVEECYIRPIIYHGYGRMGVNPKGAPVDVSIACWPWGAYLPVDMVDVKITKYIRIHPQSTVCDAKITGHYVNSILAVQELDDTKYHESMLLDYEGNIAEGPGENLFIVKDGVIYTPQLGNILKGITRDSAINIAKDLGYTVIEKKLQPEDAFTADEAFFTGSAAEVTPIKTIDDHVIGNGQTGPITAKIKETFMNVVHGRNPKFAHYLTLVK